MTKPVIASEAKQSRSHFDFLSATHDDPLTNIMRLP
jgi:hypothetical protein